MNYLSITFLSTDFFVNPFCLPCYAYIGWSNLSIHNSSIIHSTMKSNIMMIHMDIRKVSSVFVLSTIFLFHIMFYTCKHNIFLINTRCTFSSVQTNFVVTNSDRIFPLVFHMLFLF